MSASLTDAIMDAGELVVGFFAVSPSRDFDSGGVNTGWPAVGVSPAPLEKTGGVGSDRTFSRVWPHQLVSCGGHGEPFASGAVPPDTGEKAEAIVVLGRGWQQNTVRSLAVLDLLATKRAPMVFPSGRQDALVIASLLKDWAVPTSAIAGEACSLTTEQNAAFTAALLWPQGVRSIILVTDGPHMLRSLLTFESFGFKVIPHMVPLDAETNPAKSRFLVFRESFGLLSYGIMGRYFSREVPPTSVIYADRPLLAPVSSLPVGN